MWRLFRFGTRVSFVLAYWTDVVDSALTQLITIKVQRTTLSVKLRSPYTWYLWYSGVTVIFYTRLCYCQGLAGTSVRINNRSAKVKADMTRWFLFDCGVGVRWVNEVGKLNTPPRRTVDPRSHPRAYLRRSGDTNVHSKTTEDS